MISKRANLGASFSRPTRIAPEYIPDAFEMSDTWPDFMGHDEVAAALLLRVTKTFPHLNILATLNGVKVARGMAAPFALHTKRRNGELPTAGWDRVLVWAFRDLDTGTEPDTVTALEMTITLHIWTAGYRTGCWKR